MPRAKKEAQEATPAAAPKKRGRRAAGEQGEPTTSASAAPTALQEAPPQVEDAAPTRTRKAPARKRAAATATPAEPQDATADAASETPARKATRGRTKKATGAPSEEPAAAVPAAPKRRSPRKRAAAAEAQPPAAGESTGTALAEAAQHAPAEAAGNAPAVSENAPAVPEPEPAPKASRSRRGRKQPAEAQHSEAQQGEAQHSETQQAQPQPAPAESAPALDFLSSAVSPAEEAKKTWPIRPPERSEAAAAPAERGQREVLLEILEKVGHPVHVRDFERHVGRADRDELGDRASIEERLSALARTGQVVRTRRRTYGLPAAMNLVRGRFQGSSSGFGFVIPSEGGQDFYVAPEGTLEAWNGDTVLVRPEGKKRGDSPQATVIRVVGRAYRQLVGSLEVVRGYPMLRPDDHRVPHRVLLMPESVVGTPEGARVVAELYWPEDTGEDEVFGQLTRVLGEADDPETETQAVIVKYDLREEFSQGALAQAEAIPLEIPAEALEGRMDLRGLNTFTVDGADAKDFDDAIHIRPVDGGGFEVGIHIADVSHYVTAGSPLDVDARERATSVYLPGRVLPMLPERLSNGVCSLVPHQDRLTLSAVIRVNAEGEVQEVTLAPSIIHSKARLTYDEVQAYSEALSPLPEHARALEGDLHLLLKLTGRMRQRRLREGSLDFRTRELRVDVDSEGRLQLIPIGEETARGMIEDMMLLANRVVARELLRRQIPTLFRVHEAPTQGRFGEVAAALKRLGIAVGEEPTPQAYQQALKQVRGTPQERPINTLLLRSLKQAVYAADNLGHFGLAFPEYLHFTSPIRRYPDLIVHRVLREAFARRMSQERRGELSAELPGLGLHTSDRERKAAEAERDLSKYYQCRWAAEHLGEDFEATVSGVTSFGVFAELENGVEGLLHISNLDDDYYVFLEDALMLRGKSSGKTYRIGDRLAVTVAAASPLARQIDFSLQETDMSNPKARARRRDDERPRNNRGPRRSGEAQAQAQAQETQPQADAPAQSGGQGGSQSSGQSSGSGRRQPQGQGQSQGGGHRARRVVTLERPRNEHLRPVNITVQRMYFGDWTTENMPADDGDGGGGGQGRGRSGSGGRGGQGGGRGNLQPRRPQARPRGGSQGSGGQPQAQAQAEAAPAQTGGGDAGDDNRRRRRRRRSRGGGTGQNPG